MLDTSVKPGFKLTASYQSITNFKNFCHGIETVPFLQKILYPIYHDYLPFDENEVIYFVETLKIASLIEKNLVS